MAIFGASHIALREQRQRREEALLVAEITAASLLGPMRSIDILTAAIGKKTNFYSKFDCAPTAFKDLLDAIELDNPQITDEQLVRLAPIASSGAHSLADAIVLFNQAVTTLRTITKKAEELTSEQRKERARLLATYLLKSNELVTKAEKDFLKFLNGRGVPLHEMEF